MLWQDSHLSRSFIPFRNFLDDCLVWTIRQCCLWRKEKGTRNSVFPRRVTLYVVGGKLRRRSSRTKEWPKPRKIRKLSWEKSKLRKIKAKLDEAYLAGLTECTCTSARVNRTEDESPCPHPTNGPRWAVRSDLFHTFSEHWTFHIYYKFFFK